ncbi:amino acid adenylation domain-containing protein, partial [Streptomyces sp. SID2955]|nr:amino acid adenylation domain-containing protein [Streptomyces sp. SID2955]
MREDERTERLLRILAGVLPDADLTPGFPLREQGLESLALTRVWFQIRKEFGADIPVSWLRRCPTPAALLARIAEHGGGDEAPEHTPAAPEPDDARDRHEPFPLTDMQQAYLVAKGRPDDPAGCHVYREFEVEDLDVEALERAWRKVVAHHDMLRAVVTADGRQRILPDAGPPAIAVGPRDAAGAVRERLSHHRYEPGTWPLHTVEVSHAPDRPSVVHLSIDALIIDGHGLGVLLQDWWRCYHDPAHEPARPAVTVRGCVRQLDAEGRTAAHRARLDHWADRLTGLAPGPAPSRPAGDDPRRVALTGRVDRRQWETVNRLAASWEVSPTALVLTLFAETFGRQRDARPLSLVLTTSSRSRLPAEAQDVIGPFTSSLVLPLPNTLDRPLRAAAGEVHQRLWEALDHSAVSGVAALRALRAKDRTAADVELPVVFTSLLGSGRSGDDGFAGAVTYAVSQTTGVALDHQMWERDGALHLRWDLAAERFAPGEADILFAAFLNSLHALGDGPVARRSLNDLQQAYFVPRAAGGPGPWDGCQVHHSFEVDDLDVPRLTRAWLRLVDAYDVLRTVVTHDGALAVAAHVPSAWAVPVVDLAACPEPDTFLRDLSARMAGRAHPLGRAPHSELCVTVGHGPATVHLTTDLTTLDGRSIHFLVRELFRLYADPGAAVRPSAGPDAHLAEQDRRRRLPGHAGHTAHWRQRVADLYPGPSVLPAGDRRARQRFAGQLTGWRAVKKRAQQAGLSPDDLLAAACTQALAEHFPVPFSLPVVRWTEESAPYRPGEYTALSWVTRTDAGLGLWEQAAAFRKVLDEDRAADGASGLAELRRRVMRERRDHDFDLPVVYTGRLDVSDQPLPAGVRLGPWLTCTPDVALDCIALDEGDVLRFYWDATAARFPPGRLDTMFARYRTLLESLTAGPERWNATETPFPADRQVQRLFEEQAALRPDAVAVRWSHGGTLSFDGLNRWANRIAWALREHGVAPGTPVGISVRRGPAMVAAVYGVLKAGGCYVPLEPSLPAARAAAIIGDAGITLIVGEAGDSSADGRRPVPAGVTVVPVDAQGRPEHTPEPLGSVDDTAYVIFTSGSTGRPKGVAVSHRPLLNLVNWCVRTHGFGPRDVGLCVTSLGFDLSVFDILGLLGHGASLYVADETEQRDPQLLLDVLLNEPITFWNSAPTTLARLAPLFPGRFGQAGTDTLRMVYLSGDFTPLPLPDEIRRLFPGTRVVSLGGATEATVWSNWFEIGRVDPAWRSIPYGRPIDNARYYILDQDLRPCGTGVEGDLYIGGECLSQGYHRQPALTAERFVSDPFADRPGARMYRTGDRASFFPDGVICFHGRADSQV